MRNRDGSADTGVTLSPLTFCDGGGRANGFGGPVAPAESNVEADGDGGGRTSEPCRCVTCVVVSAAFFGDVPSAVGVPASEPPSGICTVSRGPRGRAPPAPPTLTLLDRDGGVKVVSGIDGVRDWSEDWVRCGGEGLLFTRDIDATSID